MNPNERKTCYADFSSLHARLNALDEWGMLHSEYGDGQQVLAIRDKLAQAMADAEETMQHLVPDAWLKAREPDDYDSIRALCAGGNIPVRKIPDLADRMSGAVLGRFIGCTLGAPVEGWSIERMKNLAGHIGMEFPPRDYWTVVEQPWMMQYNEPRKTRARTDMSGVPTDDDITYSILGLLILEKYGFDFTTNDVGEYWKEHLPLACTAEAVSLNNLKAGMPAMQAAEKDNPYVQWIGADIRADGFAWAAAGDPALAASMGYRDAYLSHRRNGIYGEMFFAAAEAAAFVSENPIDAIRAGLREIPSECSLALDVAWALEKGSSLRNYEQARQAVDERFAGMHPVHTNNNACLTIFGLFLGGGDFTETVANVVAMGLDNDCTAATAGSILGAVVGQKGIPSHWIVPFHDEVRTYIKGAESLSIRDVTERFLRLARTHMD